MKKILLFPQTSARLKILSMLGLTALADFLFYKHNLGWTVGLFGLLLTGICVLHNIRILKSLSGCVILLLILGQCLLQIEKTSLLSFVLMLTGIVSLAALSQGGWKQDAILWFQKIGAAVFRILRPWHKAMAGLEKYWRKRLPANSFTSFLQGWFLPAVFSCVFVALFSNANPIIGQWFSGFTFRSILGTFSIWRVLFWVITAIAVFSVIRPKIKLLPRKPFSPSSQREVTNFLEWAFTKEAVLRSLVLFNLLFAFQTAMDINYLWAGQKLPANLTLAQYAHKGAYPLIVTALLAAVFVLVSQNAGQDVAGSRPIQTMIYAWVLQNILLVISSIYRTGLYVEVYALTYWRVAAFIWMGLVACGLAWIIVRSVLGKSNTWLINANVLTLLAVLYTTSFVNIGSMIAQYNVTHSREISGGEAQLDHYYMQRIGASAIPAMMRYVEIMEQKYPPVFNDKHLMTLAAMKGKLKSNMDDWRRWTYSEYRQFNALESHAQ